jgi:hypothetical protein
MPPPVEESLPRIFEIHVVIALPFYNLVSWVSLLIKFYLATCF